MTVGILRSLGFRRNWIYEVIVTTKTPDGRPHSAPMGVFTEDLRTLKLRVYKKTKTCRNLMACGFFTVSLPDGVLAFKKALSHAGLKHVKTKTGYRIAGGSFLEMEITGRKKREDVVEFRARIISYRVGRNQRLFNRAEALTLEYLIKKTKPHARKNELSEIRRVVNKVAPKSIYCRIVK